VLSFTCDHASPPRMIFPMLGEPARASPTQKPTSGEGGAKGEEKRGRFANPTILSYLSRRQVSDPIHLPPHRRCLRLRRLPREAVQRLARRLSRCSPRGVKKGQYAFIYLISAGRRRWRECTGSYSAAPDPLDVPTPGYTLGLISPAHSAHAHALHMLHMCAMPVRRFSFGKLSQQPLPEPLELSVSRVRPHGRSSGSPPARL
jgi:hypothetical protein